MAESAFGVDVGGTFTKIAAVSGRGDVLRLDEFPTDPLAGPVDFLERVVRILRVWRRHGIEASSLGLALAGDVDHVRGRLRFAPNLSGWRGFPFGRELGRRMRLPMIVENDANAAVWGAYVTQLKRQPRHVVGVTLGTGVGGGLIIDGCLHRGGTGTAGEIGHTRVAVPGELCHCGARGCLEAYVGNHGITRTARRLLRARPGSGRILRAQVQDLRNLTPKHLQVAARLGDPLAREVWERTGEVLGLGLANLVLLVDPDVLMLLGGVSRAGHWIIDPIRRVFRGHPFGTALRSVELCRADNPNAGCVGAALLALEGAGRR